MCYIKVVMLILCYPKRGYKGVHLAFVLEVVGMTYVCKMQMHIISTNHVLSNDKYISRYHEIIILM